MSHNTRGPLPAPGWYPDPAAAGSTRFWDGGAWTSYTAPAAGGMPSGRRRMGPQRVGFGGAVALAFRRIVDYRGRSSRREYWWFQLAALLVGLLVGIPMVMTTPAADDPYGPSSGTSDILGALFGVLYLLYLAVELPLTIRRLHDIGRRGWWLLLGFAPFGGLVLLVFFCGRSQPDVNAFGPGPAGPYVG
ncbi:MAG: DUF805 domain-containing protein [Motilibacteraceae bacterium]